MKIAFFELFKEEQGVLAGQFSEQKTSYSEEKLTKENVASYRESEVVSVFVNSIIDKEIIDLLPNLKFINTSSTGFDHIDIGYCAAKGIKVSNVPAYGSITVAEFTFALLLALSRKIFQAVHQLREEGEFSFSKLEGFNLNGKTIGVLGTGKIGKNVIRIAKGFGMKVLAFDPHPDLSFARELNFEYQDLEKIISGAEILTLHAPYSKENHHLINKERISLMKKGVYLINTARGELIDTNALIWGLKEGIIAGAGLDVLEGERELKDEKEIFASPEKVERVKDYKILLEDKMLIDLPNVLITPHIAFYSKEAENKIIEVTIENIKSFLAGTPQNLVQ
jgi:D-lactate dehydrogenase